MQMKIVLDCNDLRRQADFWCLAADYHEVPGFVDWYQPLKPNGDRPGPILLLQRVPEPKSGKNRLHIDLHPDDGPAWVERLQQAGAARVGELATEFLEGFGTTYQVMTDPEGNEFCVIWRSAPQAWD